MFVVRGTYHDGQVKLENPVQTDRSVPVIVTFLEDIALDQGQSSVSYKGLDRFTFSKTREKLRDVKVCLSDAVIEGRESFR